MIAKISEDLVWNQIVARAWCDDDFMKQLLSNARPVFVEYDLDVPAGAQVEVVLGTEVRIDDAESVRRFTLPPCPTHELMEEILVGEPVAGCASFCNCGFCARCGACGCRCRCF